jgi:hypothetical protein
MWMSSHKDGHNVWILFSGDVPMTTTTMLVSTNKLTHTFHLRGKRKHSSSHLVLAKARFFQVRHILGLFYPNSLYIVTHNIIGCRFFLPWLLDPSGIERTLKFFVRNTYYHHSLLCRAAIRILVRNYRKP